MRKDTIVFLSMAAVCFSFLIGMAVGCQTETKTEPPTETETTPQTGVDYYTYAESLDLVEIINANDLTFEELNSRNGKLIIERVIGIVEDAENGVGHVLFSPNYEYISYESVKGIRNGNIICTYLIYNPDTNYEDDILMRFDYVIDSMAVE